MKHHSRRSEILLRTYTYTYIASSRIICVQTMNAYPQELTHINMKPEGRNVARAKTLAIYFIWLIFVSARVVGIQSAIVYVCVCTW